MKAVILAAGKGIRMLPLTKEVPKVLVEVNGRPFLYYVLKSLQKAGFSEFGLVVGYKKEKIADFLEEYEFKAELIEQSEQKGTGHALLQARRFCGKEDFVMLGGDNLWSVEDLISIRRNDEFNYACGFPVDEPRKYGVFVVEGDKLVKVVEKPKEFVGNLINTGLFKFKSEIFSALGKVKLSPRNEIELTDAVSLLAKEGKVKVLKARWWMDLGCKEDIPKISEFLRENLIEKQIER